MSNYNSRDIFFSFKEYSNNYNILLTKYLSKHNDFDEKNFIEHELELYIVCLENATLTTQFCNGAYNYEVNSGNCKFYISKIQDSLITLNKVDGGWNLELALQYQATFKKIIAFLNEKKNLVSNIKTKKYNYLISAAATPEVQKLLTDIFYKKITLFTVVNYLQENTNTDTYHMFLAEFNSWCIIIFNEFMFEINQDDIKTALEQSANNLEYVYAYEDDLLKFSIFIKDFGGFKTVQNVSGLLKEEKEKTIKLIYLNNLMIDYYDGFFIDTILGFENISHLKYVYNFLNNIDKDNKGININNSPIRANKKLSLDVIKPSIKTEVINIEITDNSLSLKDKINPYPRIFKNYIAYNVFTNLLNEFGIIKDNLANYSFIYHRMKKDELIYDDFQQIQFVYFLLEFNINIDRIKRMEDIGKIALRESIYIKAK